MTETILIACGGTGGHVFPAIAVADALKQCEPNINIVFVGSDHGKEKLWVEKAGYPFEMIEVRYLKGSSLLQKIKVLLSLRKCAADCKKLIGKHKPALVMGSGGYVSGPLVYVASKMKVRTAILEQNAIFGLTNRILSKRVDTIYTSFEMENIPAKVRDKIKKFGNPTRSMATNGSMPPRTVAEDGTFRIFVFGGSQGAAALNEGVPENLKKIDDNLKISILHQAGAGKCDDCRAAYRGVKFPYQIVEFVDDMKSAYRDCDLVICRAGATSIAELRAAGKAAVLVPFPFAAHNHQEKNADAVVKELAAWKILNEDLKGDALKNLLLQLIAQPLLIEERAANALSGATPDAAVNVAKDCLAQITD